MTRRVVPVVIACVAVLAACSSGSSGTAKTPSSTAAPSGGSSTTTSVPTTKDTQVWLCRPGQNPNPCLADLTTTIVAADGTKTTQKASPAADPKIDCFYVYPTVSEQQTVNATLSIDSAETNVAIAQASRYSQTCRVYAPIYRQVTMTGLGKRTAGAGAIAFEGVLAAWKDYLARYNDGRGVVLIGHSQGSGQLTELISKYIEPDAAVRSRVVSAILLGGNVLVPTGKDVGGDFTHLTACRSASQTGCVIAFSSFDHTPPSNSLFGRSRQAGDEVLCTNPAALAGGSGPLDPYYPTHLSGGVFAIAATALPSFPTPWVSYPDLFTGECKNAGGASWLQVTDVRKPGDTRPKLRDALGETWGLHLYDGNIALGNLTGIVAAEAAAYLAHG